MKRTAKRRELGRYVISDPQICHGALTFKGTRIFVKDVLEQVAEGVAWDEIVRQWHSAISHKAIAEAIRLASDTLIEVAERRRAA
jgi:uncharacterized protein (DUF433 family)